MFPHRSKAGQNESNQKIGVGKELTCFQPVEVTGEVQSIVCNRLQVAFIAEKNIALKNLAFQKRSVELYLADNNLATLKIDSPAINGVILRATRNKAKIKLSKVLNRFFKDITRKDEKDFTADMLHVERLLIGFLNVTFVRAKASKDLEALELDDGFVSSPTDIWANYVKITCSLCDSPRYWTTPKFEVDSDDFNQAVSDMYYNVIDYFLDYHYLGRPEPIENTPIVAPCCRCIEDINLNGT